MANAPKIDTSAWRLPRRSHSVPEALFTDDMYRRVGLPTAPVSAAGGAGRPVIDTSDWRLPSMAKPLGEGAERPVVDLPAFTTQHGYTMQDLRIVETPTGWKASWKDAETGEYFEEEISRGRIGVWRAAFREAGVRVPEEAGGEVHEVEEDEGKKILDRSFRDLGAKKVSVRKDRRWWVGSAEFPGDAFVDLAISDDGLFMWWSFRLRSWQTADTGEGNMRDLERVVLPTIRHKLRRAVKLKSTESVRTTQRRLAGLEHADRLVFPTGTPYRQLPRPLTEADRDLAGSGERTDTAVPAGRTKMSTVPPEMRRLAGMTKSPSLPYPLNDTRPLQAPKAYGILDDGEDDGVSYVESVLAESRWFFRDFGDFGLGVVRPFGEAPGGRRGPWRGSDDEPAPTPIVRKGEVHGQVGKDRSPEGRGHVDVGKSEIDYDQNPDDGPAEKLRPQKGAKRGRAEPSEESFEGFEDGMEETLGTSLRGAGGALKQAGRRLSGGRLAQHARQSLRQRLGAFARKHGIDTERSPYWGAPSRSSASKPSKSSASKPSKPSTSKPSKSPTFSKS